MRTIVDLPIEAVEKLDLMRDGSKRSRAALIRDAVDEYLCRHVNSPLDAGAFGLWKDKAIDGVEYQEQLRKEWDQ